MIAEPRARRESQKEAENRDSVCQAAAEGHACLGELKLVYSGKSLGQECQLRLRDELVL